MSLLVLLLGLVVSGAASQVCSEDRECYNTRSYCDDSNCHLQCSGTQSCANVRYTCNSTDPSSTCTIDCSGYQACDKLQLYSTANSSVINCMDWPSCTGASVNCDGSDIHSNAQCTLNCNAERSCESMHVSCSNLVSQCTVNCADQPHSCDSLSFDCSNTCNHNCPSTDNLNLYCPNTQCSNCNADSSDNSNNNLKSIDSPSSSTLSSTGYHVFFAIIFIFLFLYTIFCTLTHRKFFEESSFIDAAFSLLPLLSFLTFYETLSCLILAANNTYFSSYSLPSLTSAYLFSILIPLHLLLLTLHTIIWYLYLIYYGTNSSLNYLHTISSKLSPKYPRIVFLTPLMLLSFWTFICLIIAYSMHAASPSSALSFLCVIIILESLCGVFIALKLLCIALNYVQMQYVLTNHQDITMKLCTATALASLIVFAALFAMAITAYDTHNRFTNPAQLTRYTADGLRVLQLLFECLLVVLCDLLFVYIPPAPQLHTAHRSTFHDEEEDEKRRLTTGLSMDEQEEEEEETWEGFDEPEEVLIPGNRVMVKVEGRWDVGTVKRLVFAGDESTQCYVEVEESGSMVVIELHSPEVNGLKLAVFGVDPELLDTAKDDLYGLKRVPEILLKLRDKFFELEGHLLEGVFRKESMRTEYEHFKFAVEQNRMDAYDFSSLDVHAVGTLIKDFYRSMPDDKRCLGTIDFSDAQVSREVDSIQDIKRILNGKDERYRMEDYLSKVLVMWIWNLCADISEFGEHNKMTIDALAIVISPNLYYVDGTDPKQFMLVQQNVEKFCSLGIQYVIHKRQRKQSIAL